MERTQAARIPRRSECRILFELADTRQVSQGRRHEAVNLGSRAAQLIDEARLTDKGGSDERAHRRPGGELLGIGAVGKHPSKRGGALIEVAVGAVVRAVRSLLNQ